MGQQGVAIPPGGGWSPQQMGMSLPQQAMIAPQIQPMSRPYGGGPGFAKPLSPNPGTQGQGGGAGGGAGGVCSSGPPTVGASSSGNGGTAVKNTSPGCFGPAQNASVNTGGGGNASAGGLGGSGIVVIRYKFQ